MSDDHNALPYDWSDPLCQEEEPNKNEIRLTIPRAHNETVSYTFANGDRILVENDKGEIHVLLTVADTIIPIPYSLEESSDHDFIVVSHTPERTTSRLSPSSRLLLSRLSFRT